MRYKRQGLLFSMQTLLFLLCILTITGVGINMASTMIANYRTDKLISDCNTIDNALEMYAHGHRAIKTSTFKVYVDEYGIEHILYDQGKVYPKNLQELGYLQSEFGYIARSLFARSKEIDYANFNYRTGYYDGDNMRYELSVRLPNGQIYTSPHSTL